MFSSYPFNLEFGREFTTFLPIYHHRFCFFTKFQIIHYLCIRMPRIIINPDSLHIRDSHRILTRKEMEQVLDRIRTEHPDKCSVMNRTNKNLVNEWATHNLCYNLHILRRHTGHADFEYPQPLYFRVAYWVVGPVYFFLQKLGKLIRKIRRRL